MPKYINFDALGVQSCNPDVFVNKGYAEGWNGLMRILYAAPAADVEPVKHGHWISAGDFEQCSVCKATHLKEFTSYYGKTTWIKTPRCPQCGAKMGKEADNGNK